MIDSVCNKSSISVCNNQPGTKCDQGYKGIHRIQIDFELDRGPGMLCAQCEDDWFSSKLDALVCKTCPDPASSTAVAVIVGASLYAIGVLLAPSMTDLGHELPDETADSLGDDNTQLTELNELSTDCQADSKDHNQKEEVAA